jgi:hypothetical protein
MAQQTSSGQRRMRATLVRFGPDLFEDLKVEAERSGISVAQFVREAVVARIAYNAGKRGELAYEPSRASTARDQARRVREESAAVRAESKQAASHAREVRTKRDGSG